MPSLHTSSPLLLSSSSSSSLKRINGAILVPKLPFPTPKVPIKRILTEERTLRNGFRNIAPVEKKQLVSSPLPYEQAENINSDVSVQVMKELYVLLESVADRVAMHDNIDEQRNNWNTLLLNSINTITLSATTIAAIAATAPPQLLALKLSSALLFSAATGMMVVVNKIQPSQLAEEQRNASRLFRQLHVNIQTILALQITPTQQDMDEIMDKVLTLDRAYPLPLLGKMIQKFPETFQPSEWWPKPKPSRTRQHRVLNNIAAGNNGWSDELEQEMRRVVQVLRKKDGEDYMRLGNLALRINKVLAISGPLLSGIAAVGSAFVGSCHHAPMVAVVAGALAATVNSLEHGGQVGMVVEMYRYCAGFFQMLGESIESTLEERDVEKRENGEVFEMKVALQLGRSLSQLRELANNDEFASKLF